MAISASKILTNTLPVAAFPKRFLIIIGPLTKPAFWQNTTKILWIAIQIPDPMCRMIHC